MGYRFGNAFAYTNVIILITPLIHIDVIRMIGYFYTQVIAVEKYVAV